MSSGDRLRLALLLCGLLAATPGHAAEPTPEATIRKSYAVTQAGLKGERDATPWLKPHRDLLFSRSLAALFARDQQFQDESGDMGHIGADPFIQGQDGEVKNLRVATTQAPSGGKAVVTAQFRSFGKPVAVTFRMVEEGGGWRIDDIGSGRDSIRRELSQPYECGSFMKKPCKR